MSIKVWLRHPIREFKNWKRNRKQSSQAEENPKNPPLREFVYLDSVSLRSLLVSQNETLLSESSEAISNAEAAETSSGLQSAVGSPLVGGTMSANTTSKYQTSSSTNTQSSRKAVIQTWFKQFRELPLDFKLSKTNNPEEQSSETSEFSHHIENGTATLAQDLKRGDLVEVEVTLSVDPIFKLAALMEEYTAMADEAPQIFGQQGLAAFLGEAQPLLKLLDRFLAGLVPIKAMAVNHGVAEIEGRKYIVDISAVKKLKLDIKPLYIVGVTEQAGYWKDMRRVLFSEARYTVMCRVARDSLHSSWTPVKLAELFSDIAPDFADQINSIRMPSPDSNENSTAPHNNTMEDAIESYKKQLVSASTDWDEYHEENFQALKRRLGAMGSDVISQRKAFDDVRDMVKTSLNLEKIDPNTDLEYRNIARTEAGLELFQSPYFDSSQKHSLPTSGRNETDEHLLDADVIAIYW